MFKENADDTVGMNGSSTADSAEGDQNNSSSSNRSSGDRAGMMINGHDTSIRQNVIDEHYYSGDDRSNGGASHSQSSGNENSTTKRSDDDDNLEEQLTEQKSKIINRLRAIVMIALVLAAFGVSITVFILSRKADTENFEIQYEGNVDKVFDAFESIYTRAGAISALGAAATTYSEDLNTTWPFQTLSHFHKRGGSARELSGALFISLNHFVNNATLLSWESYVSDDVNQDWIHRGHEFQSEIGVDDFEDANNTQRLRINPDEEVDPVHIFDNSSGLYLPTTDIGPGPYMAVWETSPVLHNGKINEDSFQTKGAEDITQIAKQNGTAVMSAFINSPSGSTSSQNALTAFFSTLLSIEAGESARYLGDPMAYLVLPIFDSFDKESREVVGLVQAVIHWKAYFRRILPEGVDGIRVVVHNECSGSFTYEIQGEEVYGVGWGDLHDADFDEYERHSSIDLGFVDDGMNSEIAWEDKGCPYTISIYPSLGYYRLFISADSVNVTFAVGMVFFYSILMFIFYDRLVESRQRIILAKATKSTAIVASLFPKNVRDRLLKVDHGSKRQSGMLSAVAPTQRVKTFLGGNTEGANEMDAQPIADLFPHCTVFFADIAGFTAWSSTREPAQVFLLLEALYGAFDKIAKKRRVFKVETIGDSYVAVTGLPEPQANHAVIMASFTYECLHRMEEVVRGLEVSLGPDTGELSMRFGLHSGPITAGVLKGDRARFQLFGDTVNTAARMESTGMSGRIQISATTAELLKVARKQHWVKAREDSVHAKGKGVLQTYWLEPSSKGARDSTNSLPPSSSSAALSSLPMGGESSQSLKLLSESAVKDEMRRKEGRLVDWMVAILSEDIKKIIAVRNASHVNDGTLDDTSDVKYIPGEGQICLDEVQEAMNMQEFNADIAYALDHTKSVVIDEKITESLREYVAIIAASYKENPFHNFPHACHVTMSVHKLLSRIVAPELTPEKYEMLQSGDDDDELARELNDYSHGIVHDPMALFAITFAAMIHDVDHQGISNMQLGKEHPELNDLYRGKSIAEQNSLDVAWDVLMDDKFKDLRKAIFQTNDELLRFRQLIVNVVLATDIFDKEFNDLRKSRWEKAFSGRESFAGTRANDLRATIVIEHIIQASDVSHTMQHWHVYRKWNTSLFKEMYAAFKAGRMGADPSSFWYEGEMKFFDNYVIPLAKKLKDCNVFGVSSHEYLAYAMKNRAEWEDRGQDIVKELVEDLNNRES